MTRVERLAAESTRDLPKLDAVAAETVTSFDDSYREEATQSLTPAMETHKDTPKQNLQRPHEMSIRESLPAESEPVIAQPMEHERIAEQQPDLRGEILSEVQELLRWQESRASEEFASRSLAQSRARLACYR